MFRGRWGRRGGEFFFEAGGAALLVSGVRRLRELQFPCREQIAQIGRCDIAPRRWSLSAEYIIYILITKYGS